MFIELLPSFADELLKLAYVLSGHTKLVDEHLKASQKDWPKYEKNLGNKKFVQAVLAHPGADEKLKKYTQANHEKLKSKETVAKVKSRTEKRKSHKVVKLPSGRLACGCRDWQYMHSHKGTDCDHIKQLKKTVKDGLNKSAALAPLARGIAEGVHGFHGLKKAKTEYEKGLLAKAQVQAARKGEPAIVPER